MKMLSNHDAPGTAWSGPRTWRLIGAYAVTLLLAASVSVVMGCGGKPSESPPPAGELTSSGAQESMLGATNTISLNWDQQDSCVSFVPGTTTIHPGDRVNFTTSVSTTVTVYVPAGLFSAGDTSITVSRGANTTSPVAQSLGTYPLTSSPRACPPLDAGGGPAIIVNEGETKTKP